MIFKPATRWREISMENACFVTTLGNFKSNGSRAWKGEVRRGKPQGAALLGVYPSGLTTPYGRRSFFLNNARFPVYIRRDK